MVSIEAEVDDMLLKNDVWRRHVAEQATMMQRRMAEYSLVGLYYHTWMRRYFKTSYTKVGTEEQERVKVAELHSHIMNQEIQHKNTLKALKQRHADEVALLSRDMQLVKKKFDAIAEHVVTEGRMARAAIAAPPSNDRQLARLTQENDALRAQVRRMALEHQSYIERVEASRQLVDKICHEKEVERELYLATPDAGQEITRLQGVVKFLGDKTNALQASPNTSIALLQRKVSSSEEANERLREEIDTLNTELAGLRNTVQLQEVQISRYKTHGLAEGERAGCVMDFFLGYLQSRQEVISSERLAWDSLVKSHCMFLTTKVKCLQSELLSAELSAAKAAAAMSTTTLQTQHLKSLLNSYQLRDSQSPKREGSREAKDSPARRLYPPSPSASYTGTVNTTGGSIDKWNVQW